MKKHGFTLIELMIVVAIIAIIAAIAIGNLLEARMDANEQSAMNALRAIREAQTNYHFMKYADKDGDDNAEFADDLPTLTATTDRGTKQPLLAWRFSGEKKNLSAGYYFQLEKGDVDTNEAGWVAWAWPASYGNSGVHTFRMDCFGELRQTEMEVFNPDGSQRPAKELAGKLSWEPTKKTE